MWMWMTTSLSQSLIEGETLPSRCFHHQVFHYLSFPEKTNPSRQNSATSVLGGADVSLKPVTALEALEESRLGRFVSEQRLLQWQDQGLHRFDYWSLVKSLQVVPLVLTFQIAF